MFASNHDMNVLEIISIILPLSCQNDLFFLYWFVNKRSKHVLKEERKENLSNLFTVIKKESIFST
jgi:uncharacterized protein YfkK (UPF0435 family)